MKKILLTSIPKTGTHLLIKYLDLLGFARRGPVNVTAWDDRFYDEIENLIPGTYSAWHYFWSERFSRLVRTNDIAVVLLSRDPRAQVVSLAHFVVKNAWHPYHALFTEQLRTSEERIAACITGFTHGSPGQGRAAPVIRHGVRWMYRVFKRWLDEPCCYGVRFEDVIGPQGGGNRDSQLRVVTELIAFTGTCNETCDPQAVADRLFDPKSGTFRKGQINAWREDFTPELHKLFMVEAGDLLERWGYKP